MGTKKYQQAEGQAFVVGVTPEAIEVALRYQRRGRYGMPVGVEVEARDEDGRVLVTMRYRAHGANKTDLRRKLSAAAKKTGAVEYDITSVRTTRLVTMHCDTPGCDQTYTGTNADAAGWVGSPDYFNYCPTCVGVREPAKPLNGVLRDPPF